MVFDAENEPLRNLTETIRRQGSALGIAMPSGYGQKGLLLNLDPKIPAEGYKLQIGKENILLRGGSLSGLYWGWQSLRQLLMLQQQDKIHYLPGGHITDQPSYSYRGFMLDVSRHFFPVETVKRMIDLLTLYKINFLHLHLSDDQGWRIEIKRWPKLTEIGGTTQVGGGQGGFYTQEDFTDIVQYAAHHQMTIVPEIDLPGHTNAALASYPSLNCDRKSPELYTGTEVGFSTLCADHEETYQFIADVFEELAALTPGPYLHIGGDESHVTEKEDYLKMINYALKVVKENGKTPVGWDEIAHANIDSTSVAQYWARSENAVLAVEKKARVLLSPASHAYLDMQYDSLTPLGLHWAGFTNLKKAYQWKPETLVANVPKSAILGIEAPLWSETLENIDQVEFMAFPRVMGHAEIGWTSSGLLTWENYHSRLKNQLPLLDRLQVNYYPSKLLEDE